MQKQTNRQIVAAVLIAAGVLGGVFIFVQHRRSVAVTEATAVTSVTIDRMIATAADIAAAQQAYVAPGQPDQPWLERSATLLQQFGQDSAAIPPELRSNEAPGAMEQIDSGFRMVVTIDQQARQHLQQGQNLLAADLIFSEGRDTVAMLVATLRNLRSSELLAADAQRASIEHQQWGVLSLIAVLWIAGILVLAGRTALPGLGIGDSGFVPVPRSDLSNPESRIPNPGSMTIDLTAAADASSMLARVNDAAALKDVLSKVAHVLGARGIVVWMGAGEELFPALSYGYDERVVSRMGPLARNAANATAEAWRTGQVRTVSSDSASHGAVAAPVVGVSGCVGVLAAEVTNGREQDPSTCGVAAMFASQLSALVSAWPPASDARESERIAATGN